MRFLPLSPYIGIVSILGFNHKQGEPANRRSAGGFIIKDTGELTLLKH